MSSRCSYWTGESVPITGDRGSGSGSSGRPPGYSLREAVVAYAGLRMAGPLGLAVAIGASRPSRASVSVPLVYTSPIRGGSTSLLSGKLRRPAAAAPG